MTTQQAKRKAEGDAEISSMESTYGGQAVKIYNAILGYCILHVPAKGYMIFDEFGYSGTKPSQAEAEMEYEKMTKANSAYCYRHNC